MLQLSNFGVLALIFLLQGVLLLQSAKASLENKEKSSHTNENDDNIIYKDMLVSMLRFINAHKNLERERDEVEQITQNDLNESSEIVYPRNSKQHPNDQPINNSYFMEERPFFSDQNAPNKIKLSDFWGSNPFLWQANHQPITAELPTTLSKHANYRPAIISPEFRWELNPSLWGKRSYWTTRGKKPYKSIGPVSKIVEKDLDNFAYWKTRGKREEDSHDGRSSRSTWTPEDLSMEPNYWSNRGKKNEISDAIKSSNFKRELEEYWSVRGRRRLDKKQWKSTNEEGGIPYWLLRGKKNIEANLGTVIS